MLVVVALVVIVAAVLTGLLNVDNLPTVVVAIVIVATIGYFVVILSSGITAKERSRVLAFIRSSSAARCSGRSTSSSSPS